jgi:hypothetical protein
MGKTSCLDKLRCSWAVVHTCMQRSIAPLHPVSPGKPWEAMHRRPQKSLSPREMRGNSTCGRAYSFHTLPSLAPYHFPGLLKLGGSQSALIAAGAACRHASPLVGLTRSYTVLWQTLCSHSPNVCWSARYRCRTSTDHTVVLFFGAKILLKIKTSPTSPTSRLLSPTSRLMLLQGQGIRRPLMLMINTFAVSSHLKTTVPLS